MVKVLERTARKDYPAAGVKKGDKYYKWSFFRQRPRISKTPPTRSQLTQNENLATVYTAYDTFDGDVDSLITSLEEAKTGEEDKLENMPDGLKEGDVGTQIQERIDAIDEALTALEEIKSDLEDEEGIDITSVIKPADEDEVDKAFEAAGIDNDFKYHELDYETWTLARNEEAIATAIGETEPQI
jgi:hypothetical protein